MLSHEPRNCHQKVVSCLVLSQKVQSVICIVRKGGKSALAKQIAIDYVHGTNSMALPDVEISASCHNEAFIYDAELGDEDVEERYENLGDTKVKRWPNAHFTTPSNLSNI